ncbi:MAG: hypothetical protein ACFFCP_12170 [Promethearchaeota archaeon]
MPRRNNATAEAEQAETETVWKAKAHTDGDLRLPKKLRAELGIKGHSVYAIEVIETTRNGKSFQLKFSLSR